MMMMMKERDKSETSKMTDGDEIIVGQLVWWGEGKAA
jgi:hypothetical protein